MLLGIRISVVAPMRPYRHTIFGGDRDLQTIGAIRDAREIRCGR
jgi:hypothetical protein